MKSFFDFSLKAVFFVLSAAFVIVVMSLGLLLGTEILITVIDTAKSVPEYITNTINIGEETNKQKPKPPQPQPQRMDFEIYLKKIAEEIKIEEEKIKRLSKVAALNLDYHSANAAYDIGFLLEYNIHGERVPSNYVEAYKWYAISVLLGDELDMAKDSRDDLATVMTPDQIAQAQSRALEWMEKHRGDP